MTTNVTLQEVSLAATGETPDVVHREDLQRSAPAPHPMDDLERILPEIKDLALKVGGLDRLAELVRTLQEMKKS